MERTKEISNLIGGALNEIAGCLYLPTEHGDETDTRMGDVVGTDSDYYGNSDNKIEPWYDCTLSEWLWDLCHEILVYNGNKEDIIFWEKMIS